MRSLGWALIQHVWCPCKKGKHRRTGTMPCDCGGRDWNAASCKPRNAWNYKKLAEARRILPQDFRGSTALPVLWFQTVSLQNSERIHFCHFVCVFFFFFHFGCIGSSLHAGLYPEACGSSLTRFEPVFSAMEGRLLTTREVPNFCTFKPPSLWYFIMAALGNEDTFIPPTQKP